MQVHGTPASEISPASGIMRWLRRRNCRFLRAEQNQTPSLLRYAVVSSEKNFRGNVIAMFLELSNYTAEHLGRETSFDEGVYVLDQGPLHHLLE